MPTRLLREGILSSERVDLLDAPAEVFYRRLMSKVDDHGLYDARPSILRASLYPLRVDRVREADILRWLAECESARLIALFAHNVEASSSRWITVATLAPGVKAGLAALEKPYLKMLDTRWQVRAEAKFPLPPDNNCKQPESPVHLDVVVDVDVVDAGKKRRKQKTPLPDDFCISDRVRVWGQKNGIFNLDRHLEDFISKCRAKDYQYVDWDEAFMNAVRNDWARIGKGAAQEKKLAI
jgi:hypothetical protein